jgi:hypothetical protein
MIDTSLARPGLSDTPEEIAARIEEEIDRVRQLRPALYDRLDRAANILGVHLSCPRHRPIRVRVRDGRATFLVNGSKGAVYVVEPRSWSCSCPDFHRADLGACKHSLACFVLWRASRAPRKKRTCCGCDGRFPAGDTIELHDGNHDNLMYFHGDVLCRVCAHKAGVEW